MKILSNKQMEEYLDLKKQSLELSELEEKNAYLLMIIDKQKVDFKRQLNKVVGLDSIHILKNLDLTIKLHDVISSLEDQTYDIEDLEFEVFEKNSKFHVSVGACHFDGKVAKSIEFNDKVHAVLYSVLKVISGDRHSLHNLCESCIKKRFSK